MNCEITSDFKSIYSLTKKEFNLLKECIQENLGIKMPDTKKAVLEARLQKRLRMTGIKNFSEYCDFLFSEQGELERSSFIDAVTTHKTFFFRESDHLTFLCNNALPILYAQGTQLPGEVLDIWSAGCSSGEEAYSIAIQLEEFKETHPGFKLDYSILATDVSRKVVEKARAAVYKHEELDGISINRITKFFLKSRDKNKKVKKIVPEIRKHLRFGVFNLNNPFQFDKKLDVIFCRNVMIYFDEQTKTRVVKGFVDNLRNGGYLFIGSSESIRKIDNRLNQVGASVYQRQ